ncbi:eukaryotic translation initiation factor eIF2A-domain-containing protein [Mycena epipterygia]|nr:eukaryotic translation initiation factor eIF2A-domain-containing protein [Mycena epipterygia]
MSNVLNVEGIDYSDMEAKYHVQDNINTNHVTVVDGVPIIDKKKESILVARVAKVFTRRGVQTLSEDIWIPWDDSTGKSKGFIFIEFPNAEIASSAVAVMHGFLFFKHQLKVNHFDDIHRYSNMDINYIEPELEEFQPKEHLRAWLAEGRDQYVTNRADQVNIHWHGKRTQSGIAYKKPDGSPPWTELYVSWSPLGSYLASVHQQGVRLWGGPSFAPLQRFRHPSVLLIDLSPEEKYLVTWSQRPIILHDGDPRGPEYFSREDEGNNIAVWDVQSGALLRTFLYVARVTPGQHINVYELPGMLGLIISQGLQSLQVEGVVDFEWRPFLVNGRNQQADENMLVYWTPEAMNQPARVTLLSFPACSVLRRKNLFNVNKCNFYWQSQGDFLCVQVDRHTKTKKSVFCNLEFFRTRERDFPVEVVEPKDVVLEFSWEPKGERFAIICSNDPNVGNPASGITLRTEVSFYQLDHAKGDSRLLRTFPALTSNTIRWSPRGRFVVLATIGSPTKSELLFWDLGTDVDESGRQKEDWGAGMLQIGTADHYGVTGVEWDPSERYLATSASSWKHQAGSVWNLQEEFKQFIWRPRPPSLLSQEQRRRIRKNLREFSRQFDQDDAQEDNEVSAGLVAHRKRLLDEWNSWRGNRKKDLEMAHVNESDAQFKEVEVWIDELIKQIEEVVK